MDNLYLFSFSVPKFQHLVRVHQRLFCVRGQSILPFSFSLSSPSLSLSRFLALVVLLSQQFHAPGLVAAFLLVVKPTLLSQVHPFLKWVPSRFFCLPRLSC